jgi:hypothetical protein
MHKPVRYIKRLKRIGTVRQHNSKEYLVKVTVVLKVLSYITTVAVKDKELVISPAASFLLRTTVKNLL